MAAFPDDITHLDEPHTYREMFQRIMWLMEKDAILEAQETILSAIRSKGSEDEKASGDIST